MPTSSADNSSFVEPRPDDWVACLPGKWIGPLELYHLVRHSELGRHTAEITGVEGVDEALSHCSTDAERAVALAGLRIRVGDAEYRICHGFRPNHTCGQGGHTIQWTSLDEDGKAVLKSIAVVRYDTYLDDSEDHETSRSENTYLFSRGSLQAEVFSSLE